MQVLLICVYIKYATNYKGIFESKGFTSIFDDLKICADELFFF